MELNSLKKVELLRKGLYARQLQHYSGLCQVYREILESESRNINYISDIDAERVFAKYAPLLNAASKGDYSFLETHSLSRKDVEFFKTFAYHSLKMDQYKTADSLLRDAIDTDAKTQRPTLSTTNLNKFKDFMREPLECEVNDDQKPLLTRNSPENNEKALRAHSSSRLLDITIGRPDSKFKYGHSPRWLGHTFFKISRDSLDLISSIDQSHLPSNFKIADKLTPASFGAEITGVKGYIQKFAEKFQKKDKSSENIVEVNPEDLENFDPFTEKEQDYFAKKPGNFHEKVYNQVIKAQKGSLKKVIVGTLALATFASVAAMTLPSLGETRDFNAATKVAQVQMDNFTTPMSIDELNNVTNDFANQNYTNIDDFKEDANYTLDAIQQTCQTYLNQYELPTVDDLKSILNNLDDVTSMLIEKPVELAYQQRYPDFSNFKADLYYNDMVTNFTDLNKKVTEEGVKVTATDPNGNEISTEIPNIGSPLGSNDLFKRVLKQERGYDRNYASLFEALSNPSTINPNTGKTYTYSEIRDLCNEFFTKIMQDCEVARTLTAPNVVIQPDGTFKFELPEQELDEVEPTASTSTTVQHSTYEGPELD